MNFALVYVFYRLLYRVWDFFHHWYFDSSRKFAHYFLSLLEQIDQVLAIRVTLKYFFQPLYKDYSILGRLLGVIFRSGRILIGLVIYIFIMLIYLAVYLAWLAIPPAIIIYAVANF